MLDYGFWSETSSMTSNVVNPGLYFRSVVMRELLPLLWAIRTMQKNQELEHAEIFPRKCEKSSAPCLLLENGVSQDIFSAFWGFEMWFSVPHPEAVN